MTIQPKNIVETATLIQQIATRSAEFPPFMASHLPMTLYCMAHMGADRKRLISFIDFYHEEFSVPQQPEKVGEINKQNWKTFLGDRKREADYRIFFGKVVDNIGGGPAIRQYLPQMLNGIAANALHPLMRLAYGVMRKDDREIGNALGFWAAVYLPFEEEFSAKAPDTNDPAKLVLEMQSIKVFRKIEVPDSDLLWRWIQTTYLLPEYQAFLGRLIPDTGLFEKVRTASVALYAETMTFEALHALTGCHWMRLVSPHLDQPQIMVRQFWEVIMALYTRIEMPDLPSSEELDAIRKTTIPSKEEIFQAAVISDDEHDISLTFSCFKEFEHTGDSIYPVLAAKRLGLI